MEISILLAEQILAMFLTMAVGFGVVRAGLFKTEDSRIISNMVVYICNPCVVVHSFQIELTDDKIKGADDRNRTVSGFGDMISPASMMVIGMVIGDVDLKWVFHQKRPYLICLLRLIVFPLIAVVAFAGLERSGIHPDAEYILMIVLIATSAPAAAMITQLAQIYGKDSRYASVINVMSVIFCIITMPVMVLSYEMLIAL